MNNFEKIEDIIEYILAFYPLPFYNFTIPLNKKEEIIPHLTEFCNKHEYKMRVMFCKDNLIKIQLKKIISTDHCENVMLGISRGALLFGFLFAIFLIVKTALV